MEFDVIIIGGGAAGFFCAANIIHRSPTTKVAIIEQGAHFLEKVKISGGGRCNVTNIIDDPQLLRNYYPRGKKELLGPFTQFNCADTRNWFQQRGVKLKAERDGRVFPITDSSSTIIDCLYFNSIGKGVKLMNSSKVMNMVQKSDSSWEIQIQDEKKYHCKNLVVATGSSKHFWDLLNKSLNIKIVEPVPSLFTFKIKDDRLDEMFGISFPQAKVKLINAKFESEGALLITHWGLSGPAILKLSAFAARALHDLNYHARCEINFIGNMEYEDVFEFLNNVKLTNAKKIVSKNSQFGIPNRFWENMCLHINIDPTLKWADLDKKSLTRLSNELARGVYEINGKSTFKDEFVTAGGVDLKQINFKNFSSKNHENLYFGGEVLDIDAITGGFNFQAAWTSAFLIAEHITTK